MSMQNGHRQALAQSDEFIPGPVGEFPKQEDAVEQVIEVAEQGLQFLFCGRIGAGFQQVECALDVAVSKFTRGFAVVPCPSMAA